MGPSAVAEVERLLSAGQAREAVLTAYLRVERDVIEAYRIQLPPEWTHRELLFQYLRPDMGPLVGLLAALHARFEPVRYGSVAQPPVDGLVDQLRALYAEPQLRNARTYPRLPPAAAAGRVSPSHPPVRPAEPGPRSE
ncbi:MAG TPA: hypothetical protein VMG81_03940 [Thermoplasmata archaeon]|nr:hypothetical protein [Thermoplasmata archaeon]